MKIQGRKIINFELPVYIQTVSEHMLHKDDFIKLINNKEPWWEIFILTIDKYVRVLADYYNCKWAHYVRYWVDSVEYGKSDLRQSHYTCLYFWHDNELTLMVNGKEEIIKVNEGELISFPSLIKYEFKNDLVTGFDISMNN